MAPENHSGGHLFMGIQLLLVLLAAEDVADRGGEGDLAVGDHRPFLPEFEDNPVRTGGDFGDGFGLFG